METIKEVVQSFRAQISERISNPLTGAFCISWAIWNWRFVIVLIGLEDATTKFVQIDDLYGSWFDWALRAWLVPLATAVAYLSLYPRLSNALVRDYRTQQRKLGDELKQIEGSALLSRAESAEIRQQLIEANLRLHDERGKFAEQLQQNSMGSEQLLHERDRLAARVFELEKKLRAPMETTVGALPKIDQEASPPTPKKPHTVKVSYLLNDNLGSTEIRVNESVKLAFVLGAVLVARPENGAKNFDLKDLVVFDMDTREICDPFLVDSVAMSHIGIYPVAQNFMANATPVEMAKVFEAAQKKDDT